MVLPYFILVLSYISAIPRWFREDTSWLNDSPHLLLQTPNQNLSTLLTSHLSLVILGNLTAETYASIQPTQAERLAWSKTVTALLNIDGRNCSSMAETIPSALRGIYTVQKIDDEFCALVEVGTVQRGGDRRRRVEYKKGWGIFVVQIAAAAPAPAAPASMASHSRSVAGVPSLLHLSAPHPVFDLYTAEQAMRVFERSGAKSLYIPGRSREAFREPTECVVVPSPGYWKTDAVHDDKEMMFETYKAILDWQMGQNGGGSCAFIQIHGKGKRTCRTEQVFLSAGLGRGPASLSWYTDPSHASLPVHRLLTQANSHFPLWNVTTPASPHSSCGLAATKNIIGRLINGVPQNIVCVDPATVENTSGLFVHIEQDIDARKRENWETWAEVFLDAFQV